MIPSFITRVVQSCLNVTAAAVTCRMPRVPLPVDFETELFDNGTSNASLPLVEAGDRVASAVGPNGRDRADIYVGIRFDGFRTYDNLTEALPASSRFQFYMPPIIDALGHTIEYNPRRQDSIDILVCIASPRSVVL